MNYFIIAARYNNGTYSYISNTSPIIWTDDISFAKQYDDIETAKIDLEDDFITLSATISYSNINSIWICKYNKNNEEMGRSKFL